MRNFRHFNIINTTQNQWFLNLNNFLNHIQYSRQWTLVSFSATPPWKNSSTSSSGLFLRILLHVLLASFTSDKYCFKRHWENKGELVWKRHDVNSSLGTSSLEYDIIETVFRKKCSCKYNLLKTVNISW